MEYKKIKIPNIHTDFNSHSRLSELFRQLLSIQRATTVYLDFSECSFIASNQFAIIGCIFDTYKMTHPNAKMYYMNLGRDIKRTIQTNGFHRYMRLESRPDTDSTTIPFRVFGINQISQFEKYILMGIFDRKDIPKMSGMVREKIIDNILEIFNNVKEHTNSKRIYTCGQYFPKKNLLYFTIVDYGETIPYNVNKYCKKNNISLPENHLAWAIMPGNTTRLATTPGGLGLSLIQEFIDLNNGELYIVSGNETYEKYGDKEIQRNMKNPFPGTIVTVAINLSDKSTYCFTSETEIVF